jgi:hypothetical protein
VSDTDQAITRMWSKQIWPRLPVRPPKRAPGSNNKKAVTTGYRGEQNTDMDHGKISPLAWTPRVFKTVQPSLKTAEMDSKNTSSSGNLRYYYTIISFNYELDALPVWGTCRSRLAERYQRKRRMTTFGGHVSDARLSFEGNLSDTRPSKINGRN